ncbi:hypothetical protein L681_01660 [Stenotrophomonas maltophilia MF89]|nr:hypothetical protein L681_01660 [Stenotrophomonas maltophilia MF89]
MLFGILNGGELCFVSEWVDYDLRYVDSLNIAGFNRVSSRSVNYKSFLGILSELRLLE